MHTEFLEQGISAETRRAIFLNDKLAEGHPLEQCIEGRWELAKDVDTLDVMLNPADYRVRLKGLTCAAKGTVGVAEAVLSSVKVAVSKKVSRNLVSSDAFVTRLLAST